MSSTSFKVEPLGLEESANRIEGKAKEFKSNYESIYAAVSDLRVKYKGDASDTFNERIEGYKNDFQAADTALKNYVQFVRDYAKNIKDTENDLRNQASSLSVGS